MDLILRELFAHKMAAESWECGDLLLNMPVTNTAAANIMTSALAAAVHAHATASASASCISAPPHFEMIENPRRSEQQTTAKPIATASQTSLPDHGVQKRSAARDLASNSQSRPERVVGNVDVQQGTVIVMTPTPKRKKRAKKVTVKGGTSAQSQVMRIGRPKGTAGKIKAASKKAKRPLTVRISHL